MSEVVLGGRDPRRAVATALGLLLLGLVLVVAGVATRGTYDATTLAGAVLTLVGLVLVARLPAYFDRSVLRVRDAGLSWEGVGAADWSAPWSEVAQVRVERARRACAVVVVLPDGEAALPCRPGAADEVRRALARHAPGVPVVDRPPAR